MDLSLYQTKQLDALQRQIARLERERQGDTLDRQRRTMHPIDSSDSS
jgi:hypothetical protein